MKLGLTAVVGALALFASYTAMAQPIANRVAPADSRLTDSVTTKLVIPVAMSATDVANIAYNTVIPYVPSSATIANIAYNTVIPYVPSYTTINNIARDAAWNINQTSTGYGSVVGTGQSYPDYNGNVQTFVCVVGVGGYNPACPGGTGALSTGFYNLAVNSNGR